MIPAGSFFESAPDRGHAVRQSGTVSHRTLLICRRMPRVLDYKSYVRSILPRALPLLWARGFAPAVCTPAGASFFGQARMPHRLGLLGRAHADAAQPTPSMSGGVESRHAARDTDDPLSPVLDLLAGASRHIEVGAVRVTQLPAANPWEPGASEGQGAGVAPGPLTFTGQMQARAVGQRLCSPTTSSNAKALATCAGRRKACLRASATHSARKHRPGLLTL